MLMLTIGEQNQLHKSQAGASFSSEVNQQVLKQLVKFRQTLH